MAKVVHLLAEDEGAAVGHFNRQGAGEILLVCEHASKTIPRSLGTLGLDANGLEAHIAWDPGALAVAKAIAKAFDAHLIHQNFSRLVYDCNRPPEAEDAMPSRSEVFEIPGNVDIDAGERQARVAEIYRPFQQALVETIAARKAAGRPTVLVTIHSFTPVYKGKVRDVEIGILHDRDTRFADLMLDHAQRDGRFVTRRNEPYGPADGVTHTLREHGLANSLPNVMIEVRNDLIRDEAGQEVVAGFLVELMRHSLSVPA